MIECMRNAACEHMTLDEQISFCEEKSKNIKLKTKPQTFVDIKNGIEKTERIERCGMSAGMNLEEAKIVADKMTYADAVCNAVNAKCVPYRKATGIKLKELLKIAKSVDEAKSKGCNEISTALYYDGFNDGYSKALDDFFSRVIADIDCKGMCGRYEKEIAEMFLKAFDDSEEKISCNCQYKSNSRDNEPCCRCDSKVSENDDTKNKVTFLEIIVRMIDNKPYYEIKYKKVGEDYYHVGYSSFNIDNVLKWRDECFELVDVKATNADRIRNMSDEEMAERIASSSNFNCADYCDSFTKGCTFNCGKKGREIALKWLQSEAE